MGVRSKDLVSCGQTGNALNLSARDSLHIHLTNGPHATTEMDHLLEHHQSEPAVGDALAAIKDRALSYLQQGRFKKALFCLSAALSDDPENEELQELMQQAELRSEVPTIKD